MATELFAAIKGGDKAVVEALLDRDHALVDARPVWGPHPEGMPTQEGGTR